mgnify:FL=1
MSPIGMTTPPFYRDANAQSMLPLPASSQIDRIDCPSCLRIHYNITFIDLNACSRSQFQSCFLHKPDIVFSEFFTTSSMIDEEVNEIIDTLPPNQQQRSGSRWLSKHQSNAVALPKVPADHIVKLD